MEEEKRPAGEAGVANRAICPSCGKEVEGDPNFCPYCRAQLKGAPEPAGAAAPAPAEQGAAGDAGKSSAAGIIAGVAMAVIGGVVLMCTFYNIEYGSFGGDAYTYIYHGVYAAVQYLILIARAVGASMLCGGIAIACAFINGRRG